ncbi:MAG: Ig-like domain-containing protein [Caldicoprobacterales bacterium]|jgi:uncharacterized protein YjdB
MVLKKGRLFTALVMVLLVAIMAGCTIGNLAGRDDTADSAADKETLPETASEPGEVLGIEDTEADLTEPDGLDEGDIVLVDDPYEDPEETELIPEETEDPEDSSKDKSREDTEAKPSASPKPESTLPYEIEIDVTNQVITVFGKDKEGKYTKVVKQFICSTGRENKTPLGTFKLQGDRSRWGYFTKFNTWAQYLVRIKGPYLFHSILFDGPDESTIKTSTLEALGRPVSAGCIRLMVHEAKWIYDNVRAGTVVRIVQKAKNSALTQHVRAKSLGRALPVSLRIPAAESGIIRIRAGESLSLKGLVKYTDNKEKEESGVQFSLNSQEYAKLEGKTLVGLKPGKAVLTAQFDSFTAVAEVEILPMLVQSVKLDKSKLELEIGGEYKLTASVNPSNATNKKVLWSSSDSRVATVDNDGRVKAKAEGTVQITVTTEDGGKTAVCTVKVVKPAPTPTPEPSDEPTPGPTEEPTPDPTQEPTQEPTSDPTQEPTEAPTSEPAP